MPQGILEQLKLALEFSSLLPWSIGLLLASVLLSLLSLWFVNLLRPAIYLLALGEFVAMGSMAEAIMESARFFAEGSADILPTVTFVIISAILSMSAGLGAIATVAMICADLIHRRRGVT